MDKFIKIETVVDETKKQAAELEIEIYRHNEVNYANGTPSAIRAFKKFLTSKNIGFEDLAPFDLNFEENQLANVIEYLEAAEVKLSYRAVGMIEKNKLDQLRKFGAGLELQNEEAMKINEGELNDKR